LIFPHFAYAHDYPGLASDVEFIQPLQLQLDRNHLSPQHLSIFLRPIPTICPALPASTMQIRETLDTAMMFSGGYRGPVFRLEKPSLHTSAMARR
jgi:hypothetical protein